MFTLKLEPEGLAGAERNPGAESRYDLRALRQSQWEWDQVVKSTHLTNCWYQRACNFNLYVKDGVVLREEQAGNYPAP
ncbi:MAG: hypothetical protein HYV04_00515, partial [Deltaproteobacteria bacterium]|nr:hypothetical protein [Deltaproteobacteria bacterium]